MTLLDEQLTKYLTDAHSIEQQALSQLRLAPRMAGDPQLADVFRQHERETERQERLVRERLEARAATPSKVKSAVGRITGLPFALFARSQPDTPGKLVAHAFSYEHMELAAYDLLERVATRAGDEASAATAREIGAEEGRMIERLSASFDTAVEASLREKQPTDVDQQVTRYLEDAHAIEAQAVQMLERAPKIGGDAELERLYREHLAETHRQRGLVEARLDARGASPSRLKDAVMRLGALNWGAFFQAQPDTPAKLAAFAFAFEHLEVAAYELLARTARRAGDEESATTAERIRDEERAMGERLRGALDRALDASLEAVGATV